MKCFICNKLAKKIKKNSKLYYLRCDKCDFEFFKDYKKIHKYTDYSAKGDYNYKISYNLTTSKFNEYEYRSKKIDEIIKKRKTKMRILDLGCGEGYFLKKYKNKAYIKGIEINKVLVNELAKKKLNYENIDFLNYFPKEKYDLILLFAVLEHLPDLNKCIQHLKNHILSPRGKILLDVPSIKDPLSYYYNVKEYRELFYKRYHIYYFSKKSLVKIFKKNNLKVKVDLLQQASITNHFNWIYKKKKQANQYVMSNPIIDNKASDKKNTDVINSIIDQTDSFYRKKLIEKGISDLLFAEVSN